ncbi:prepilin-type N-terminal cleavage/methylation domain-containing protein [Phragmitibacter flavus]|uniref:Prepilin-type N-terminal cleavage/methylation domain-containing protein n=1 Tax=Phragmitibacter flavus TaxID=2576071 RepID=A0A5R8KFC1_9BACT|nr:prepilin-type N-terminal cleavage/methylation domain-containing protein [Phragmitibacter flavus]TLD70986.1 prepilin-type N-terminal cleavage/methylation domain-containing protein [Phragmitibacter flavus]
MAGLFFAIDAAARFPLFYQYSSYRYSIHSIPSYPARLCNFHPMNIMKLASLSRRQSSAFTLIELLVVITIIAILASISVPVGGKIMERAKILQAKTAMKGIEIAINGYRTEYNRMPLASTAGESDTAEYLTDSTGMPLLAALMAQDPTNNPRQIKFYEPPSAKGGANGYVQDGEGGGGGLFDPWSRPYTIEIDYSGNGQIPNPFAGTEGHTGEPENVSASVIIYSDGPDETPQTKDDVKSWN